MVAVIHIHGAPFDYCGYRIGSRMGPGAVRLAGLAKTLESVGVAVEDRGDVEVGRERTEDGGIKNMSAAIPVYKQLKSRVGESIREGSIPLVIGGDHSLAIGSVAGALEVADGNLAVLWIDAHVDLNTPDTSPSGNLHGMVLGALLGLPCDGSRLARPYVSQTVEDEWARLGMDVVGPNKLSIARTGWFAVRDVDEGEKRTLRRLDSEYMATMYDIDRHGAVTTVERLDSWLRDSGAEKLWISFDVDALDPILAPGTGTAVRGGLSYREMHVIGEMLSEMLSAPGCPYSLAGLDLVEINPLFDTNNETARTAVEWIASLFGKTILGSRLS